MANQEENDNEKEKAKPSPKTIIQYSEAGEKANFVATLVDEDGKVSKTIAQDDKARKALKKFVSSL